MSYRSTWESKFKPGKKAPHFEAVLHDGSVIHSKDLAGQKLVIFFYNHDGSETCTKQACNVRDHYKDLLKAGYTVFGVSVDSEKKHQNFISKYKLPYPLISDKGNALAKAFDIYGTKTFMGRTSDAVHRTTFVIDENWKIVKTIHPVISKDHVSQILG